MPDLIFRRASQMLQVLIRGSQPLSESSSETARSTERYRRALLAGIVSGAAKVVGMGSVLVSLPITLRYLGVQRFSVWVTVTSLTALLSFADFGLGNGLMNAVARCDAKGDEQCMREYVSSTFFSLLALASLGLMLALLVVPHLPWATFLAVDRTQVSRGELDRIMIVVSICLSIGIPAAVVQKVQLALQFGYLASLWQLAASLVAMLALLGAVSMRLSLAWLVAAWLATPTVVLALASLVFWRYQMPKSSPSLSMFSMQPLRELMRAGLLFFIIQLSGTVAFSSDALILAHVLGPTAVAEYSVVSKLFDGVYTQAPKKMCHGYLKAGYRWDVQMGCADFSSGRGKLA